MKLKNQKFTIIELLIVISILSILASLLSPALKSALEGANNLTCKTNLKEITFASFSFADDNDDYTVPAAWFTSSEWNGRTNLGSLEPYTNTSIANPTGTYTCPTVDESDFFGVWQKTTDPTNQWYQQPLTNLTYGVNAWASVYMGNNSPGGVGEKSAQGLWGPKWTYWGKHGRSKISEIRDPEKFNYFMDHEYYMVAQWVFNPTKPANQLPIKNQTRWHKPVGINYGIANMSWFDGSVTVEPDDTEHNWRYYFYNH